MGVKERIILECKSLYGRLGNSREWILKGALADNFIVKTEKLVE